MANPALRAVLRDFGGVLTESVFLAFRRFEPARGLPQGFLRSINSRDPDDNAWARFERAELAAEAFDQAYAADTGMARTQVRGRDGIVRLYAEVRADMLQARKACKRHPN